MSDVHRDWEGKLPTRAALEALVQMNKTLLANWENIPPNTVHKKLKADLQMAEAQLLIGAYSE